MEWNEGLGINKYGWWVHSNPGEGIVWYRAEAEIRNHMRDVDVDPRGMEERRGRIGLVICLFV